MLTRARYPFSDSPATRANTRPRWAGRLLVATLALASIATSHAQSFHLVGVPSGGPAATIGQGVSYSGDVVAGWSAQIGGRGPGWVWTGLGGRQDLSTPGLAQNSGVYGLSGDGTVLVGETGAFGTTLPAIAYRYNRDTGQVDSLGVQFPDIYDRSRATAASRDGSVVAGFSSDSTGTATRAFRWTPAGGLQALPFTSTQHFHSEAHAVSADGQTVVGYSQGFSTIDAVVWGPGSNYMVLPHLPGTILSQALGSNSTTSIIVGNSGIQSRGVMWQDGTIIDLGMPDGYFRSFATGVSDDGAVVIGNLTANAPDFSVVAALWRPDFGWQPLDQYLASIGVTVPDSVPLYTATGISRDGRTVTGYTGVLGSDGRQEGFVVTIPSPGIPFGFAAFLLALRRSRRLRTSPPIT